MFVYMCVCVSVTLAVAGSSAVLSVLVKTIISLGPPLTVEHSIKNVFTLAICGHHDAF